MNTLNSTQASSTRIESVKPGRSGGPSQALSEAYADAPAAPVVVEDTVTVTVQNHRGSGLGLPVNVTIPASTRGAFVSALAHDANVANFKVNGGPGTPASEFKAGRKGGRSESIQNAWNSVNYEAPKAEAKRLTVAVRTAKGSSQGDLISASVPEHAVAHVVSALAANPTVTRIEVG